MGPKCAYIAAIFCVILRCSADLKFTESRPEPSCTPPGCPDHVEMHMDVRYQENPNWFIKARNAIIQAEKAAKTGGRSVLSPKEVAVNDLLMKFKAAEIAEARKNIEGYPPAMHFFHSRDVIEKSQVFLLIKRMPKGELR